MNNTTSISDFLDGPTFELSLVIYLIIYVCIIIYPFFVYAFKINRDRDKKMLLFPTVQHFYDMVQVAYLLPTSIIILMEVSDFLEKYRKDNIFSSLCNFLASALIFSWYHFTKAFHLTTFLLAFQRFLVFFFPKLDKRVAVFQKLFFKKVWRFYFAYLFMELVFLISHLVLSTIYKSEIFNYYFLGSVLLLYVLQLLSTLFYIPIIRSARSIAYVTSGHYYMLQKYIYWQTLTTLILESITMLSWIVFVLQVQSSMMVFLIIIGCMNFATVPLAIQISYLGSKRWIKNLAGNISSGWNTFFKSVSTINIVSPVNP